MPSNYNNIDQAYILPERGINDAQKLGFLQNQRQIDEQREQRLYEKQKANQWRNLNLIQYDLNFDKYKTGEQAIDGYAQGELKKIQDEALKSHINDEPAQLEYWLQSQVQPLSQWHTMAQGTYQKLNQSLQDLNKQLPNIDFTKARDLTLNQFQHDFLDVDANGNITRKNTDQIKPTDYASFLQQPQILGALNNDQSAFSKFFYDIPKSPIGDKQYVNKQGHIKEYGWSGMMPQGVGELVTDEDNRPTSVRMRGEIIPSVADSKGEPMRMIPDDIFQQLKGNAPAYTAALGKWYNSHERQNAERAFTQQTKQPLTPDVEDMLFKNYLYKEGNRLVEHDLKTEEKQATPKISSITNVNLPKYISINDVYGEIKSKLDTKVHGVPLNELSATAQKLVIEYANKVADREFKQGDIFIGKDAQGRPVIMEANVEGSVANPQSAVIAPIDFRDINLPANNSVKQKQVILKNKQPQQQNKIDKKKFVGVPEGGF